MSGAPATWSVRPATSIERADTERDVTNTGPSLEEDSGCTSLEEEAGSTLEDEASLEEDAGVSLELDFGFSLEEDVAEELLAGDTTTNDMSNF